MKYDKEFINKPIQRYKNKCTLLKNFKEYNLRADYKRWAKRVHHKTARTRNKQVLSWVMKEILIEYTIVL